MITYTFFTDTGDHTPNEDCLGRMEKDGCFCFACADGLGGHGAGEVASAHVVAESLKLFQELGDTNDYLKRAFSQSQSSLLERQREEHAVNAMKTTLVLLQVGKAEIRWGHIGDTRLYYFRKNRLVKRTLDHSVPQMLVLAHRLREKEIRNHPDRNRLLRVMGTEWDEPRYELSETIKLEPGKKQAFLLCTDGFWELIQEKDMQRLLKKASSAEEWLQEMVKTVKENGKDKKKDNFSAVAVWIDG